MRYFLLLLVLLPACSLFTDDATPALNASHAREKLFRAHAGAFRTFVERATGVDAAVKAKILAGIDKDLADYSSLAKSMDAWLEELGSVDYVGVAKRLYEEWRAGR